jgi:hypothetical protein
MNNGRILTESDFAGLPYWACVGFAARCARRIEPLYRHGLRRCNRGTYDAPRYERVVERAIRMAEESAKRGRRSDTFSANESDPFVRTAVRAVLALTPTPEYAAYAGVAADAAEGAVLQPERAVEAAAASFENCLQAIGREDLDRLCEAMHDDFEWVKRWSKSGGISSTKRVPPEFFERPLWPSGLPDGWPL